MNTEDILLYKQTYPDHYNEFLRPHLKRYKDLFATIENSSPLEYKFEINPFFDRPLVFCIGGGVSSISQDSCGFNSYDEHLHNIVHSVSSNLNKIIIEAGKNHCGKSCERNGVADLDLCLDKEAMLLEFRVFCCCHAYENYIKELILKMSIPEVSKIEIELGSDHYSTIINALFSND
jgi:hypothetical protein